MKKKSMPVRILTALGGLALLALAAGVVAEGFFGVQITPAAGQLLASTKVVPVLVKILLALALLALAVAAVICALPCRKPKQADSIMQKGDHGTFGITVKAIEKMVLACAAKHPEIIRTEVSVREVREGLLLLLNVEQAGGVSIPLSIDLLQKQVSQYVKGRTGLDVTEVRVMVDNLSDDHVASEFEVEDLVIRSGNVVRTEDHGAENADAADQMATLQQIAEITQQTPAEEPAVEPVQPPMPPQELEAAVTASERLDDFLKPLPREPQADFEEDEKPLHQRVFAAEEEPITVAMPPAMQGEPAIAEVIETADEPEAESDGADAAAEAPAEAAEETPEEDWTAPSMQAAADAVLTGDLEAAEQSANEQAPEAVTAEEDEEKPEETQPAE